MPARSVPPVADQPAPLPAATVNEAHLVGRLAAVPEERELPSGDPLVTFRVIVTRPPERRVTPGRRPPTVDTIDCVAWGARERRKLLALEAGASVEVWGSLRRRFYRGPRGLGSRYEIAVDRVARAAAPVGGVTAPAGGARVRTPASA